MNSVVIDSDVIINYFKGKIRHLEFLLVEAKNKNIDIMIPTVIYVEIMIGYEFTETSRYTKARAILRKFQQVDLTPKIANLAAKIGRENKIAHIGTVDLIVAATALALKAEVATENTKHFKLVPGLKLFSFQH